MSEYQHCEKCGDDESAAHWYPRGGYYECDRCFYIARLAARKKGNGYYGDDRRKGEQTNGEQLKLKSFD